MKSAFTYAKPRRKTERGNALALFGVALAGLASIIGLVIHLAPASLAQQNLQTIADNVTMADAQPVTVYTVVEIISTETPTITPTATATATLTTVPCQPTITPTLVCFDCSGKVGGLTSPSCPSTSTATATITPTATLTTDPCQPTITPTLVCFDCSGKVGGLTSPSCPSTSTATATITPTATLTTDPCQPTITPTLVCFDCGGKVGGLTSPSCPSTPTATVTRVSTATSTPTLTKTLTSIPCQPTIARTPTLVCFDCNNKPGMLTSPACPPTPTQTAIPLSLTFTSVAAQDGWILESSENSYRGGWLNSTSGSFPVGDDNVNRQYRSIISFNTANLPDAAIIQSAVVRIRYSALTGTPLTTLGVLWMQVKQGFFNSNSALELADFNAAPSSTMNAGSFSSPVNAWYSASLTATGRTYLNRTGTTQFRLNFAIDDNNNYSADNLRFLSSESLVNPPELVITYVLP